MDEEIKAIEKNKNPLELMIIPKEQKPMGVGDYSKRTRTHWSEVGVQGKEEC